MLQVPAEFKCPITRNVMRVAVTTTCGHTFDQEAILLWFETHTQCPVDGNSVDTTILKPDSELQLEIDTYVSNRSLPRNDSGYHTLLGQLQEDRLGEELQHVPFLITPALVDITLKTNENSDPREVMGAREDNQAVNSNEKSDPKPIDEPVSRQELIDVRDRCLGLLEQQRRDHCVNFSELKEAFTAETGF
jgi:hypothetical protein